MSKSDLNICVAPVGSAKNCFMKPIDPSAKGAIDIQYNPQEVVVAKNSMTISMHGEGGSRVLFNDGPYQYGLYQYLVKTPSAKGPVTAVYVSSLALNEYANSDLVP